MHVLKYIKRINVRLNTSEKAIFLSIFFFTISLQLFLDLKKTSIYNFRKRTTVNAKNIQQQMFIRVFRKNCEQSRVG